MPIGKTAIAVDDTPVPADTTKGAIASPAYDVVGGIDAVIRIANGATGPSAGARVAVQVRPPGSTDPAHWRDLVVFTAGITGNNAAGDGNFDFGVEVNPGYGQVRFVPWGNSGQPVTFSVRGGRVDNYA